MLPAKEGKYTFVTVFYEDEYDLLLLQARSMRLYCDRDIVDKIIVIDNSDRPLPKDWKSRLLAEYADLSNLVEIVRAHEIAKLPWAKGWQTQQILKLMVAHIISSDRYLVLDSKNHLVFPLRREALEAADGRPRMHRHGYTNHPMRRRLEHVLAYYKLEPAQHVASFTSTATTFVMYTDIVRRLIAEVVAQEGRRFESAFIKRRLTEFFAYGCFILKNCPDLVELYDFHQIGTPCIWEHTATQGKVKEVIAKTSAGQRPFFSVHRAAIEKLDTESRNAIATFWTERSLFATAEQANLFITQFQSSRPKTPWRGLVWRLRNVAPRRSSANVKPVLPFT